MVKKRISVSQTVFLLIILVISTADIFLPAVIARQAGRDAWVSVIMATFISILFSISWLSLASKFPNEALPEYLPKILGQTMGKLVGLLYALFFLHNISIIVREFSTLIVIAFLPFTPIVVLVTVIMAVAVYATLKDIEVIARTNEALFPLGVFLLIIVILLTTKDMNFNNFRPVLENGLKPPVLGALTLSAWMSETFLILYLYPCINNKEKAGHGMIWSLALLGGGLLLGTLNIALFGIELTANLMISTLSMVQVINLANFIQRLDAIILAIWVGGIFIKLSIYLYVATLSLKGALQMKSYKPFVIPVAGIAIPLAILSFKNVTEIMDFLEKPLPFYLLTWEVLIPSIILIIFLIKKPYKQRK